MTQEEKDRAAFESRWVVTHLKYEPDYKIARHDDGRYKMPQAQSDWEDWQAALSYARQAQPDVSEWTAQRVLAAVGGEIPCKYKIENGNRTVLGIKVVPGSDDEKQWDVIIAEAARQALAQGEAENQRLREALKAVMECTGTSTKQYHIASEALQGGDER